MGGGHALNNEAVFPKGRGCLCKKKIYTATTYYFVQDRFFFLIRGRSRHGVEGGGGGMLLNWGLCAVDPGTSSFAFLSRTTHFSGISYVLSLINH